MFLSEEIAHVSVFTRIHVICLLLRSQNWSLPRRFETAQKFTCYDVCRTTLHLIDLIVRQKLGSYGMLIRSQELKSLGVWTQKQTNILNSLYFRSGTYQNGSLLEKRIINVELNTFEGSIRCHIIIEKH